MDQPKPSRHLSEIGHLFLSSIRDRQAGGAPRPQRKPPQASPSPEMDLTSAELARDLGESPSRPEPVHSERIPPITAVIASHLNGAQMDRVRDYARHLAAAGQRIGLLIADQHEFRVECFDLENQPDFDEPSPAQPLDVRQMIQAVNEMNWDLDRWLLLLPDLHVPEARALLNRVSDWTLLATSDHDGIVSAYRMLKGLWDQHRPNLSLTLLDAADEPHAQQMFRKFAGVCQQFLDCPLHHEPPVRPAPAIACHSALCCPVEKHPPMHWQVLSDLCDQSRRVPPTSVPSPSASPAVAEPAPAVVAPAPAQVIPEPIPAAPVSPVPPTPAAAVEPPVIVPPPSSAMNFAPTPTDVSDVYELTGNEPEASAICSAALRRAAGELAECQVRPPMCPDARLAVSRDRRLVLLAAARKGLTDLRAISQAYRWLSENRSLIVMALPQFAIDSAQQPQLRLLVDHADFTAELLQPMLESQSVTVQTYRKLRWDKKIGLLLDVA